MKLSKVVLVSNQASSDVCRVRDESSAARARRRSTSEPPSTVRSAVKQFKHVRTQRIHFVRRFDPEI